MLADIQNFSQKPQVTKTPRSPKGMQNIFRVVCVILFMILIFCVPGFLKFRAYCELKNYYVFAADSFKWCTLGFFIAFVPISLLRSLSTRTSTWWPNPLSASWTLTTIMRLGIKKHNTCWSSVTILFFTPSPPLHPTSPSVNNIGSQRQSEDAGRALKSTQSTRTGLLIIDRNWKSIFVSNWEFIFSPSSNWSSSRKTIENIMNGCYITLWQPA